MGMATTMLPAPDLLPAVLPTDRLGAKGVARPDLRAEYLRGASPGDPVSSVYGLQLHGGGYLELCAYLQAHFGLIGRIEYRDAFITLIDPVWPAFVISRKPTCLLISTNSLPGILPISVLVRP